jgi:hypothetical protein
MIEKRGIERQREHVDEGVGEERRRGEERRQHVQRVYSTTTSRE